MFMIFSTLEIHFLFFGNEFGEGTYTPQSMGTKKSPRALRGAGHILFNDLDDIIF
jgi:hypothetical protein